eukprot:14399524-Ditylum_brightwellii.AAC.1
MLNYLGQQEAARKTRPPSQRPGAWAGKICRSTTGQGLYALTTQEKWDKFKNIVRGWLEHYKRKPTPLLYPVFVHKDMQKGRGFLIHMGETYPMFVPFYRGIHLTLESWRQDRNPEGWKYTKREWRELKIELIETDSDDELDNPAAPETVSAVPQLHEDLKALDTLSSGANPPPCG